MTTKETPIENTPTESRPTRAERLVLVAAAVRGVLGGASHAFAAWLLGFLNGHG
ncbi:hypothetical protein [Streptomyces albicerus]|uniref:hypothetical protein n=1 Tax=Streptomyces albicerus TaxID=2569859 RepID=UPI001788A836|nr:hypothetical protein [Streptomyces albicerus]